MRCLGSAANCAHCTGKVHRKVAGIATDSLWRWMMSVKKGDEVTVRGGRVEYIDSITGHVLVAFKDTGNEDEPVWCDPHDVSAIDHLAELSKRVADMPTIADEHGDPCVGRKAVLAQIEALRK